MSNAQLALELRLRFIESVIGAQSAPAVPVIRQRNNIQAALETTLETTNESIRRFVNSYELNAPLLRLPPKMDESELGPLEKAILLVEAEKEIKSLERQLRDIETLDSRGILDSTHLSHVEELKPILQKANQEIKPLNEAYTTLEQRTLRLLQEYNSYVNTLSQIFVSWDEIVSEAEQQVMNAERIQNQPLDYH